MLWVLRNIRGKHSSLYLVVFFDCFPSLHELDSLGLSQGEKGILVKRVSSYQRTEVTQCPSHQCLHNYLFCVTQSQPDALTRERYEGLALQ